MLMCKCLRHLHIKYLYQPSEVATKKGSMDIMLIFSHKSLGTFSEDMVFVMGRTRTVTQVSSLLIKCSCQYIVLRDVN